MLVFDCRGSKGGSALSRIVDPSLKLKISQSSHDVKYYGTPFHQLLQLSSSWKRVRSSFKLLTMWGASVKSYGC